MILSKKSKLNIHIDGIFGGLMLEEFDILRNEDLVNNPTPRVAVCLCLDTSGSMEGEPIDELNKGVELFFESIKEDETALYAAEIAIITFGDRGVNCIRDFASLTVEPDVPRLQASGSTPMGEAVNLALDKLQVRKDDYKNNGVDYYQPWLVLMSDGSPNGDYSELERAKERTSKLIASKKLSVFSIGIGTSADMGELSLFSLPKRSALKLQGLKFREFFEWLSKSVARTSQSTPGENVKLDTDGIKGWGEL